MAETRAEGEIILVIGDKAWSSWSLRPWLAAKVAGIGFREVCITLRQSDTGEQIRHHSPSGKIPALRHGDLLIWESLAICEYLAEIAPQAGLWPDQRDARAMARAICAEMHAGFFSLRNEFPMDFHARIDGLEPSEKAERDIGRIARIWRDTRTLHGAGGPFLFGRFTIADAMFAPVATRFRTYRIDLARLGDDDGTAAAYAETLLAMPEMAEWGAGATQPSRLKEA